MSKSTILLVCTFLLVPILVLGGINIDPQDELKQADKDFAEHSYKPALKRYQTVLATETRSQDERGHAALRIGQCLENLKRWDDGIEHLSETSGNFAGSIWRPRLRALQGAILLRMPHHYYEKNGKVSRERWIQGSTYHYTYYDDVLRAMKILPEARQQYEPFLVDGKTLEDDERAKRADEFSRLCFNMANAIEAHRQQKGGLVGGAPAKSVLDDLKKHNIGLSYGTDPQAWFMAAQDLCQKYKFSNREALACYFEATYCRRLLANGNQVKVRSMGDRPTVHCLIGGTNENPQYVQLPDDKNPFLKFKALLEKFPESPVADDATFILAKIQNEFSLYVEALETASGFSDKFPKSRWRSDILALIQEIKFPRLEVSTLQSFVPGEEIEIELKTRNIKTLEVLAYEIDLAKAIGSRSFLRDDDTNFSKVDEIVDAAGSRHINRRKPAFIGSYESGDEGKHFRSSGKTKLVLPEIGAYVVELTDEQSTYRTLVVVSEIAIIRKTTDEETVVYVGNSEDGKPVVGADVLVRQRHRSKGLLGWYNKMTYDRGETSEEGVFVRKHADSSGQQIGVEAFAQKGENYALTLVRSTYSRRSPSSNIVLYGFTDRPVYRPSQTIEFVGNMRRRIGEQYENMDGEYFDVTITDPKGQKIFSQVLEADEHGVVAGSIKVGEEPPLGSYRVNYRHKNRWVGNSQFRIEEYKKPEFEVSVSGPSEAVRAGDKIQAKIHGEFYFGGGVADAKVNWRIYRERFYPSFNLAEPYSYLYGPRKRNNRRNRGGNRELVGTGLGVTDVNGDFLVDIDTATWQAKYPKDDHRFVVEADMTDLSRRTISGTGIVLVPRRGLFAHVTTNRGFFRVGEKASFEIRLQKPDGTPQASKGQVIVSRVIASRNGDEIVESRSQVAVAEANTNEKGLGTFDWQTDSPGRFVVRYITQDRWGESVVGEHAVWVTSPEYQADDFQLNNLEIVSDKDEYRPGETAYLMVNCQFPGSSVMVSVEAERSVLSYQVLKMNGKTAVLTLPILESHAPNVFVSVTMIHGGKFFVATQEVFVPPTHKFMDVDLTFDKDSYLPGEMATLRIDSRDEKGNGVAGQFALRVMDKAITYIAQDTTDDIRKFFYGRRRAFYGGNRWNSLSTNSGQFRFYGHLARTPDWKNYRHHGMPPGYRLDLRMGGLDKRGGRWDAVRGILTNEDAAKGAMEEAEEGFTADSAAPTASAAPMALESKRSRLGAPMAKSGAPREASLGRNFDRQMEMGESQGNLAAPEMRENFSDLAHWIARLRTDANGKASLRFKFPDSLTTWVATIRGLTPETLVGVAESEIKTSKNILARLQAPRFFTERDEIVVSGLVRNNFPHPVKVKVSLALKGDHLVVDGGLMQNIAVPAGGEVRVDWLAKVQSAGDVDLTLTALSEKESDAMRMSFPVLSYGIDKIVTKTRVLRRDQETVSFPIDVPAQRRVSSTEMEVTLSPSLATTLLEALPYLIEYPYGCTEQTMSRFMPAVVVARTLKDMGISLDDISSRRNDLSNKDKLNIKNLVPIYSQYELDQAVKGGLRRLTSLQNSNGGFGWWRADRSSVHLTAYVLHGLAEAKSSGYPVADSMIKRAADWLEKEVKESQSVHHMAFSAMALASVGRNPSELLDDVFQARDRLSIQCKAQLALAFARSGNSARAQLVMKNLNDFVQVDESHDIAWWQGGSSWWYWYDDEIETNAYMLLAMSEISPNDPNLEALSRWIVFNRSGNRWKSTRDTATAILALAHYAKAAGELEPDYEVVVRLGDRELKRVKVTAENMFLFNNKIVVQGDAVGTGILPLEVQKIGKGKLYTTCRVKYFSLEDKIEAAGYQVEVERRYYALTPVVKKTESNGTIRETLDYERKEIQHLGQVPTGTEVEVKLMVTAANNYEYIMLEDRKPAGFEPLELTSGRRYGQGVCSNMELRDEKVVFFVTWLQKGTHEITYRMRAEIPGTLNAMPCRAEAMYAPRLGGISDSWRVKVTEEAR